MTRTLGTALFFAALCGCTSLSPTPGGDKAPTKTAKTGSVPPPSQTAWKQRDPLGTPYQYSGAALNPRANPALPGPAAPPSASAAPSPALPSTTQAAGRNTPAPMMPPPTLPPPAAPPQAPLVPPVVTSPVASAPPPVTTTAPTLPSNWPNLPAPAASAPAEHTASRIPTTDAARMPAPAPVPPPGDLRPASTTNPTPNLPALNNNIERAEARQSSAAPAVRMVNSRRISLNYEVKDVGPSGISGVELWYTQDSRTWRKYDGPPQRQAPFIIEVPDEGLYGFTLVARSGVGLGKEPPQSGDLPQVWVEVDLTKPNVALVGAESSYAARTHQLTIRWNASDKNMGMRPITLLCAEQPDGPWTPIAANLENSGQYTWQMPQSVPRRFYVRVEASDLVGNVGAAQSPSPIVIDMSQPSVSILAVEPGTK